MGDNSLVNLHPDLTGSLFRNLTEYIPKEDGQPPPYDVEAHSDWIWKHMPGSLLPPRSLTAPRPSSWKICDWKGRRVCGRQT